VIVFTAEETGGDELTALGVTIVRGRKDAQGRLELESVMAHLAAKTRILVEGGPTLTAALLNQDWPIWCISIALPSFRARVAAVRSAC